MISKSVQYKRVASCCAVRKIWARSLLVPGSLLTERRPPQAEYGVYFALALRALRIGPAAEAAGKSVV